ncbi:hypothetical protein [Nocardiopsis baichengensis]|nr:hypothetical protein [Nocardiopsis baichengensis]
MTVVPADQAWFWENSWQEGECEASAQIAEGDVEEYDDVDSMFDALDKER